MSDSARHGLRLFAVTRRTHIIAALSLLIIVSLIVLPIGKYPIPSSNRVHDLPLANLIGVFLGLLTGSAVTSIAPDMEATATTRLTRVRPTFLAVLTAFQTLAIWALGTLGVALKPELEAHDLGVYTVSTLFFTGLAIIAATFLTGHATWIPPVAVATPLALLPYAEFEMPQPWNILITANLPLVLLAVVTLAAGLAASALLRPPRWPRR